MTTKTMDDVEAAALATHEAAKGGAEEAAAKLAALRAEYNDLINMQGTFERGVSLQAHLDRRRRLDELALEIRYADIGINEANILVSETYSAYEKIAAAALDRQIETLNKQVHPLIAQQAALGEKADKIRAIGKHYRSTKNAHAIARDNKLSEIQQDINRVAAPVVRSLQHMPRVRA